MTCEERRDLMLLFASGALEPAEETALRQHLATGCAACAGALAEAETVVNQIPRSLPPRKPPTTAWDNIETRVALREQMEQHERMALAAPMEPRPPAEAPRFPWIPWGIAAVLALALGLPLYMAITRVQDQDKQIARLSNDARAADALQQKVAELSRRVDALSNDQHQQLATFEHDLKDKQDQIEALLRSDQFAVAPADGVEQPQVGGKIFLDRAGNELTLLASNVKPLPPEKTYVLWLVTESGNKINAGAAHPDDAGRLLMAAHIPADAGPLAAAAVTDETNPAIQTAAGKLQFLGSVKKQ